MKVDVILPAAGTSERINLHVPKQFLKVLGKHILAYTVDCFHRFSWVRHIVVTVGADQIELTRELMKSYGFSRVMVCAGCHTRHRSILCGLKALASECSSSDVVIIHDAARPFVSEQIARQVAEAATTHGAAGVTRPLVSTVIKGDDDDRLVESLDRRLYRNSEMPQAFHYNVITSAYEKCSEDDLDYGTECLLLALQYSKCPAALVKGTDDLWKVTYQKDVYSMESVVKEKFMMVSFMNSSNLEFLALTELQSRLHQQQIKIAENTDVPANTFVVMWNWLSSQTLGDIATKICNLYKLDMPSSAVKLGLMVVLVFLQDLHMPLMHTRAKSLQDCGKPADVRRVLEANFYSGIFQPNIRSLGTDVPLDFSSTMNRHSGTDNSSMICGFTSHSSQQLQNWDGSTDVMNTDPSLTTTLHHHKSNNDTSVDNIHIPVSKYESGGISASADLTPQKDVLDYNHTKYSATLEHQSNIVTNLCEQKKMLPGAYGDVSRCQAAVRAMKDELQRNNGGKFALVVGVVCGIKSPIGEQLAELIWQRSLYTDSQILLFDDGLS